MITIYNALQRIHRTDLFMWSGVTSMMGLTQSATPQSASGTLAAYRWGSNLFQLTALIAVGWAARITAPVGTCTPEQSAGSGWAPMAILALCVGLWVLSLFIHSAAVQWIEHAIWDVDAHVQAQVRAPGEDK